jgi:hypothetical protein
VTRHPAKVRATQAGTHPELGRSRHDSVWDATSS